MRRRSFLEKSLKYSGFLAATPFYKWPTEPDLVRLTILHTNDTHSRIEPFPNDGSRNAGLGGTARRAAVIKRIRQEVDHVLLVDCGDIFQGTPYFNKFLGELEFRLMSEMGYDVATIGNHDFDGGIDNLALQMQHASFDMVSSNYDFGDTPMHDKVADFKIIDKGGGENRYLRCRNRIERFGCAGYVWRDEVSRSGQESDRNGHETQA